MGVVAPGEKKSNGHFTRKPMNVYNISLEKTKIHFITIFTVPMPVAARSDGVGLRPLACWDYGFQSHRGHGGLSVENVVCCQVEVSETGRSLVQSSPTKCAYIIASVQL